jgi:hypothetical protein
MPESITPRWLTPAATASYLTVSAKTLRRLVSQGLVPPAQFPLGPKRPRWDRIALDAKLEGREVGKSAYQAVLEHIAQAAPRRKGRI